MCSLKLTISNINVVLDNGLDMSAQVSNACCGICYNLFRIAKIHASMTTAACMSLVHSLVTSRLDYGNAILYCITDRLIHSVSKATGSTKHNCSTTSSALVTGEVVRRVEDTCACIPHTS